MYCLLVCQNLKPIGLLTVLAYINTYVCGNAGHAAERTVRSNVIAQYLVGYKISLFGKLGKKLSQLCS